MQHSVLGIPSLFDRYGIPIIVFVSNSGDSTFFMAEGHNLDRRAIAATASWGRRVFKLTPLLGFVLDDYVDEQYAKSVPLLESDEMDSFNVDIFNQEGDGAKPVTYIEF